MKNIGSKALSLNSTLQHGLFCVDLKLQKTEIGTGCVYCTCMTPLQVQVDAVTSLPGQTDSRDLQTQLPIPLCLPPARDKGSDLSWCDE